MMIKAIWNSAVFRSPEATNKSIEFIPYLIYLSCLLDIIPEPLQPQKEPHGDIEKNRN
jgi:hypothetical protein